MPQSEAQKEALEKARAVRESNRARERVTAPPVPEPEPSEPEAVPDPVEQLARTLAEQVTPGRAREEAQAARVRASGSDAAQSRLESRFADHLTAIADAFDVSQRRAEEEQRMRSHTTIVGVGGATGAQNKPIPEHVVRGAIVLINQDPRLPDTFAMVLRLHPRVTVNGEALRWRADLAAFPLHGAPNVQEGVPFGPGVGQFREVPSDEDDIGVLGPDGVSRNAYEKAWESKL